MEHEIVDSRVRESIIILKRIRNQLHHAKEAIHFIAGQMDKAYHSNPTDDSAIWNTKSSMYCIIYYSFMWYSSFLDEYQAHFISKDSATLVKIVSVRRKAQQYFKALEEIFGDIRDIRNKILAHGYRRKAGSTLISDEEFNKLNNQVMAFPSIQPYTQISNCINHIVDAIESEFGTIDESPVLKDLEEAGDFE